MTHLLFAALTAYVVLGGVQRGVEKAVKVMMPLLLLIMVALIVIALTLPGPPPAYACFCGPTLAI